MAPKQALDASAPEGGRAERGPPLASPLPRHRAGGAEAAPDRPWAPAPGAVATLDAELEAARPAIAALGGGHPVVAEVASTGATGVRTVVVVRKERATPDKYPRRAGVPAKRPLR